MAACSKYVRRLKKALEHRKEPFPQTLVDLIGKRAKSDRECDNIICGVLRIIEPPSCVVRHCKHHTAYSFCGCSENRIPGNCPIQKEYLKNLEAKYDKIRNEMIEMYGQTKEQAKEAFEKLMRNGGYSRAKADWEKYKVKHPVK